MPTPDRSIEALRAAHPELATVAAASDGPVYVVGGAVRDWLLGLGRVDADLVVVGDAVSLARRLGAEPLAEHARFATAKVELDGHEIDLATARTETYPHPGALPEVAPAASIEEELGRRDFTINAMAVPLEGEPRLIDPHGGEADLAAGLLRILHPGSFADDPTRAIRAARYAARLGFELEDETERLLRETDLGTVSEDRRRAELLRLAGEPTGVRGLELLAEWGLVSVRKGGIELAGKARDLLGSKPWEGEVSRAEAVLGAAIGPAGDEVGLANQRPSSPSQAVALASGQPPYLLLLARALGADWLDSYMREWRHVELELDGADLLAAGIPEGPALGRGLDAALGAKLDGEAPDRETELAIALRAAREAGG